MHAHSEHIILTSWERISLRFINGMCEYSLLLHWQMSPFPLLASIFGVQFSGRCLDQPCQLWHLEICRELGKPFFPVCPHSWLCSWLEADSLLAQCCAWLTSWEPYGVGGSGASHTRGQAVTFLHWAPHSETLPEQASSIRYDSVHTGSRSPDQSRVPTNSPCTSYKVTWFSAWFSDTKFQG